MTLAFVVAPLPILFLTSLSDRLAAIHITCGVSVPLSNMECLSQPWVSSL